ncbi:g4495 [Coccomyxa elongata]
MLRQDDGVDDVRETRHAEDIKSEWEIRRSRFINVGYKEGIEEGKASSLQAGFDEGYRNSTAAGFSAGLKRGKQATLDACKKAFKLT